MKRAVLLVGIGLWSLLALVVICVFIFGTTGGARVPGWVVNLPGYSLNIGENTVLVAEENFSLDEIQSLHVNATYQSVRISIGGDVLAVRYYDNAGAGEFSAEPVDGSLYIRTGRRAPVTIFGFGLNWPRLEITIPRNYAGNVSFVSTSGSLRLDGDAVWGDASFRSTSGSIRAYGNIKSEAISLSSTSGSINAGDITAGSIKSVSTSGSQKLGGLSADGMIELRSSSGSVRVGTVDSPEHKIRTSSGSITTGVLTGTGSVQSSSGRVRTD
jgi:lia operon protein LiaG